MKPRAVAALGIGQCVNWGVLYYAFAVLVVPVGRELAVPTWWVTTAFSLALLMSAAAAPTIGRWADQGRGPFVMQAGGVTAAALLTAWTFIPRIAATYFVWAAVGVCMAATLYEPAFVIVGRTFEDPSERLRALAAVTLFGGLASTVFLPGTALLVDAIGWRGAVRVLAALLLLSAGVTRAFAFRDIPSIRERPVAAQSSHLVMATSPDAARFVFIVTAFALASLAAAGFAANLVPALGERGASATSAAVLGGLIGLMQLPGRTLLMNGGFGGPPARLVATTLALHALGLIVVAAASSTPLVAAGTMIFALGSGLTTLVRPHLIQTMFASGGGGHLNGRLARYQHIARAAGPLTVAWLGSILGYAVVFVALAVVFAFLALLSHRFLASSRAVAAAAEEI